MIGFIIWSICGIGFIFFGLYCFKSKKPMRFWANSTSELHVSNISKYNHAVGKMWIIYGVVFILFGIFLLAGQNSPLVIISILGCVFDTIGLVLVYCKIEDKYIH